MIHHCNICKVEFKQRNHLIKHNESVHQGIRFPCSQCEYRATRKEHLTRHMKLNHKIENQFHCASCSFKTDRNDYLKTHEQSVQLHHGTDHYLIIWLRVETGSSHLFSCIWSSFDYVPPPRHKDLPFYAN